MKLSNKEIAEFQNTIFKFYEENKRVFPWRNINDPYAVLVSEIMLQQTQTERVLSKYKAWMKKFPDVETLAKAPFTEVLTEWNGLGYNRRARYLQNACIEVVNKYKGIFPVSVEDLKKLPGLGPYTSGAVAAFAYNSPEIFIETNIRSVYIHFFFSNKYEKVSDKDIFPLIQQTLYKSNPRDWYYALMDYGTKLKKTISNPNRKSKHYSKQSKFEGSLRQARGAVIRYLTTNKKPVRYLDISKSENIDYPRILKAVSALEKEGFLISNNGICYLREDDKN